MERVSCEKAARHDVRNLVLLVAWNTSNKRNHVLKWLLQVGVVPIGVILLGIVPVAKAMQTDRTRADELASSRGIVEVRGQDSGSH